MNLFSEYKKVNALLREEQQVVFYAESRHYYQYFEKLISDIISQTDLTICYITSDKNDPLLVQHDERLNVVYSSLTLGHVFARIRSSVMIMTMPDLGNYLLKRSKGVGTYIYIFHALVSTHQQYREKAFFHYDAIFCTGDYQRKEIRKTEALYGLPQKELIAYGYPLVSSLQATETKQDQDQRILVAPSWFDGSIYDTCFPELLKQLQALHYKVIIRSHPEYEKRNPKGSRRIRQMVKESSNMEMDEMPDIIDRLPLTDILITDRSGIAFEFALGMYKPVLFIDTVLKQTNTAWEKIGMEPVENRYRRELGISVSPDEIHLLPRKLIELADMSKGFREKMETLGKELLFNSSRSYEDGLQFVLEKVKKG